MHMHVACTVSGLYSSKFSAYISDSESQVARLHLHIYSCWMANEIVDTFFWTLPCTQCTYAPHITPLV